MKTATKISTNDQAAMLAVMRNAVDHLRQYREASDMLADEHGLGTHIWSAFTTEDVESALIGLLERNDPEHFTNESNLYKNTRR